MKNLVTVLGLTLFMQPPSEECHKNCATSDRGIAMIQVFEGYSPYTYIDSAGYKTIGHGHLILEGESFKEPLMGPEVDALLRKDVRRIEQGINTKISIPLAQHRFDALSSFAFNVGIRACTSSTLLRYVNLERHTDVPPQFRRWVYADKKPIQGLKLRREAEARLYADGTY